SVINLINTIMGTGMLSMAYAFAAVGLLGGTLLVVISAAATWFSLRLLISSARLAHGPHPLQEPSYGSLAALTIRSKFGRIVVDLIVAVSCMGMASSYIVAIGDVMPRFIADILGIDSVDPSMGMLSLSMGEPHAFWIRILLSRQFWMIAFLFVLVPLSMQFTIDDISWFSTTCLGFALYLAAVVLWASFTIGRKPDDDTPTSDHTAREPLPLFLFSERWLEVLPIFVFAFTCQQNLFSIFGELKESKAKYIGRVIDSAVIATAAIYLIVGLAGYYTFGAACDGNIINNWPMSVARLAFAGLAALSYPIQVHPCRLTSIDSPAPSMTPVAVAPPTLAAALLEVDPYTRTYLTVRWYLRYMIGLGPWNRSDDRSVVLTTIIVCTTYIMVMSVIYLDEVLAFVGATGGTLVCYIIPALFYHRIIFQSSRNKIGAWKHVGALTMATTGCVCGILGLLYSWL
ncbi:transmembrane amino acid transporter protein-domain-containing protein, partial [Polychytrium aggregatum]|uniref:transmembrane amino acid transporter protein-domain-containing protein n=1 Tax=Polychytrium aggregatum TaxID=110093 RepID=UPI0022FF3DD6